MTSSILVARSNASGLEYLVQTETQIQWTAAAQTAARFQTVREATRAAMRLPSRLRAFALPVYA